MSDTYAVNIEGVPKQKEFAKLREAKEYGAKKAQEEADKHEEPRGYIVHAVTFNSPVGRRGIPVAATGTAYPKGMLPPEEEKLPSTEPQFNPAPLDE